MTATVNTYLNTRLALLSGWFSRPGLYGKLIQSDNSQMESLLQQANIPSSVVDLVAQPVAFDRQLHYLLLDEVTLLLRATSGALRDLVIHWLRQYEMLNIKAILRARTYAEPHDSSRIELVDIGNYSSLSLDTLAASEDVNEILRLLERYGYANLAQKARRNYEDRQNLFDLEAMIDRQYYVELNQRFRFLKREQQKSLQPVFGMLLDRVNLIWLLRYRLNFGMEVSHIYYLLAPTGTWLDKAVLMKLVQQDNLADMLEQLPRVWKQVSVGSEEPEQIENAADSLLQRYYIDLFRQSSATVVRLFCYLWLRQHQLKLIAMIIKGRTLGLDTRLIANAAGLTQEPAENLAVDEQLPRAKTR